ncbi:hypothetical protein [Streptomyces sp. TP-A0874]|uniref:hypothetical protein n=1 Tax=Streptomyces sp. TP-A0874 TaxID=549819 RepID=UPI0008531227|nr:hypothetical protein [Streptomyces sp. TP-A0874]
MPDRRRRAALRHTAQLSPLLRERQSPSDASSGPEGDEGNPFAAPPPGRPDQAWRPRAGSEGQRHGGGSGGPDEPDGQGDGDGRGEEHGPGGDENGRGGDERGGWSGQWSRRQPRHGGGGFGRPERRDGGPGGPGSGGPRWDPTDPVQRRARYSMLAGLWGFFFALFSLPQIALLLGALAVYWGVSALRGSPASARDTGGPGDASTGGEPTDQPPTGPSGPPAGRPVGPRPQTTPAISGLVTGGIALLIVAATFTFQLVYKDYYTCVDDSLTHASRQECKNLLPKDLRSLLGSQD